MDKGTRQAIICRVVKESDRTGQLSLMHSLRALTDIIPAPKPLVKSPFPSETSVTHLCFLIPCPCPHCTPSDMVLKLPAWVSLSPD